MQLTGVFEQAGLLCLFSAFEKVHTELVSPKSLKPMTNKKSAREGPKREVEGLSALYVHPLFVLSAGFDGMRLCMRWATAPHDPEGRVNGVLS